MQNCFRYTLASHYEFWEQQPALLYGITILLGTSAVLFWQWPWKGMFPIFWCLYLICVRRLPLLVLLAGAALYAWTIQMPSPSFEYGKAYFSISTLQPHITPFQTRLVYRGDLYLPEGKVPCSIYYRGNDPPKADCDYIVTGSLNKKIPQFYSFNAKKWVPVNGTWSLAECRYQMKERLRHLLKDKLKNPRVASFLGSLTTGDVEDRSLRYEFSRLGLQHILAISGFHFGLLVAFCSFFLGFLLPRRWKLIFLLLTVNAYFLLVGSMPAVQRSWLAALIYLISKLMGRHSTGLNLLGVALAVEAISDPQVSAQIGFQLSFVSCGGILLLYPLIETQLRRLFPKRDASQLAFIPKHVGILSSYLRKALSLTCAVNLAILPLLLYHFHQFPLLSLLYNLFFPFLVSAAMLGLLITLILYSLCPPLAFFQPVDFLTAQLLDLASYPPLALDYSLKVHEIAPWLIPLYLFALFSAAIHLKKKSELTNSPSFL